MSDELLPCPFCGGAAIFFRDVKKVKDGWCDAVYAGCIDCGARTDAVLFNADKHPNCEEYNEARILWNARTNKIAAGNGQDYEVVQG